jgi:ATP-dependent protease Clp ATPase subunit
MSKVGSDSKNMLFCSFCGKSQHEVRKLIAGPTVFGVGRRYNRRSRSLLESKRNREEME